MKDTDKIKIEKGDDHFLAVNPEEIIMLLEKDSILRGLVKYFGENTDTLAEILSAYTKTFGEKHEISSLLKEEKVQQYVNSKIQEKQSIEEFSEMVKKLRSHIIGLISHNEIAIHDQNFNRWIKRVINGEIR